MITRKEFDRLRRPYLQELDDEREDLQNELADIPAPSNSRRAEIFDRISEIEKEFNYTYSDAVADEGDARYHDGREDWPC